MKIYEIGTGYTPIPAQISAATEIVVEELTKAFVKQNAHVEIVDIASHSRAKTDLPIREVCVPRLFTQTDLQLGIMHKLKRVVYSVALAGELKKILKEEKEKVVFHFHNQYNLFFFLKLTSASLRKKCLIVYTNHSGIWRLDWNEIKDTISRRYFQEAECMKRADIVFLLNEETKRNVMTHLAVPEDRLVVINNGVNTDIYRPLSTEEKEAAKVKFDLKDRQVILQVGSVNENKGQLRSLKCLLPCLKKNPALTFAYAGGIVDRDYHDQVLNYARENNVVDQVRYLGMLSPGKELNELYNTALATITASKYEGFVLVAVESAAAGVPVFIPENGPVCFGAGSITYSLNNISELLNNNILADKENFEALRAAARNNAVTQYSWNKIAFDYFTQFSLRK